MPTAVTRGGALWAQERGEKQRMQATLNPPYRPVLRLQRTPLDFAAILTLLLLLTLLIGAATWHFWHAQRIYSGVRIAGVPVGGLTRAQALAELHKHFHAFQPAPVSLFTVDERWVLPTTAVAAQADLLAAANQAYLVGREGEVGVRLLQQWAMALRGQEVTPPLQFNESALRQAIHDLANQVRQAGQPAAQIGDVQVAAKPGREVDVEATVQAVLTALRHRPYDQLAEVPLVLIETTPAPLSAAPSAPAAPLALPPPLVLRDANASLEFAFDPAAVKRLLIARDPVQVDEAALRQQLTEWAGQVNIAPRDARLRFIPETGGVSVLEESQTGRQLDVEATLAAVVAALQSSHSSAPLIVTPVSPAVDMAQVAVMGIRELVASGTTYFKGSSAPRVHNIEVGAAKVDGMVVPPNGVFSFNEAVENVTSANDFEDSLVILGDTTAVGAGGGICQVSTTVFRAAYAAGLPIVERYNHGYVVDWYGEPGLDATIFTPTVDFRFRNDTGAYLVVESVVDSLNGTITINLWGSPPNRTVTVGALEQSNVQKPQPPRYEVDPTLAKDEKQQVEWEHPGMTVTVTRTIVENGTTRTDTLVSTYEPWQAVYRVGPGTEIPATPTPKPSDVVTGTNTLSTTGTLP